MITVFLCVLAAWTSTATARDYFGAIAVATNGAYGYSWDHYSKGEARRAAMRECNNRGPGCRNALWFRNACGALAMNGRNSWATAWGAERWRAEQIALRNCNNNYGGCSIRRWVCTTR
ncbi:DUF4189 domain-containing protein [uncultured Cohaesibacter sp.]|uniref:DUF4189 domain-containing protein n=1 Tax=uncultured Cohaesibacter sp. TaxID=1002546 RepID=UPI0029C8F4BE|nr:DUF4189 domain-containing protein [uncultured Cohaesibacter sp.]